MSSLFLNSIKLDIQQYLSPLRFYWEYEGLLLTSRASCLRPTEESRPTASVLPQWRAARTIPPPTRRNARGAS